VIVHRPDLSLKRLTPTNHDDLLFDDVLWVERAQWEHDQFVKAMRDRGIEVFYHLDLLCEALGASEEARKGVIGLVASEYTVGWSLVDEVREFLWKMKADVLAKHLVGGLTVAEMEAGGFDLAKLGEISLGAAAAHTEPGFFVIPPVPNTLFQRDPSCWIFNGVTVNPMFWPARRREALNMLTIYRYHPMFDGAKFNFWYPHQNEQRGFSIADFGRASLEGGDVQPLGNGTVAIGMSERTQARMIEMVAKELFEKGGAERVIVAVMTKDRAHMHLDTVFTLLDRDIATAFPRWSTILALSACGRARKPVTSM
jgi:arginine deiminase